MPDVAEAPVTKPDVSQAAGGTGAPVPSTPQKESPQKGMFDHFAEKPKPAPKDTGKAGDETKTPEIPAKEEIKLLAGRFKTPEELEKAYQESSSEGLRLWQEQKAYAAQIKERDAKLAELEDQVKLITNQTPFKELSRDELSELAGKDPIAAAEYVAEKKLRDRDFIQAKQKFKEQREFQERTVNETRQYILDRGQFMASNTEKFPHFESLIPNMEKMKDIMGEAVKDRKWATDIVYLAALGQLHLQTLQKGKVSTDESAKKAAEESKATAGVSGPGGSSPAMLPGGKEDPNSDKSVKERILKAAPGQLFKF